MNIKPRQRVISRGGINYTAHLTSCGEYVMGVSIDFGSPQPLCFQTKKERLKALELLGLSHLKFFADSEIYQQLMEAV